MGYTTDFEGSLRLSRPATTEERDYINLISGTRRMKRDVKILFALYKGKHGNPFAKTEKELYGREGEYFAKDDGCSGQNHDASIIDNNTPPGQLDYDSLPFEQRWTANEKLMKEGKCQPGLWCQWIISEDGTQLEWDGGEKFYNYIEWLEYYISHFFKKWGIKLNGEIEWQGEDHSDKGIIVVRNNKVRTVSTKKEFLQYERKEKLSKINESVL